MQDEIAHTAREMIPLLRGAQSLSAVLFFFATWQALTKPWTRQTEGARKLHRALVIWVAPLIVGACVLTYGSVSRDLVLTLFPAITALSCVLAVASLAWRPAQEAVAALSDAEVRYLLAFRAIFGMFILGGAAAGLFPARFAWTGGLGDLIVSWLATASPTSLAARGPKAMRVIVHGVGVLDLVQVGFHIVTFVVPWLRGNDSPGPTAFLPWIAVPLMLALNVHGLRQALADKGAKPASETP